MGVSQMRLKKVSNFTVLYRFRCRGLKDRTTFDVDGKLRQQRRKDSCSLSNKYERAKHGCSRKEVDGEFLIALDGRRGVAEVRDADAGGGGGGGAVAVAGGVDLEGIDDPVSVSESGGVVGDVVVAGAGERGAGGVLAEDGAGVVAAEGVVEEDGEAVEVRGDVATALELGDGRAPVGRVRIVVGDVGRDRVAPEEPDRDGVADVVDLRGVDAALVGVEPCTVRRGVARPDPTTLVVGLVGRVDVAVGGDDVPGEGAVVGDGATGAARKRNNDGKIPRLTNLAVVGPVRGQHPERRPRATDTTRHVADVDDDDPGGVGGFAGDPDRGTSVGSRIGVIDTDVGVGAIGASVPSRAGGIGALVLDEAVGGILADEEIEVVEEVTGEEVGLEHELGQGGAAHEHQARGKGSEMHLWNRSSEDSRVETFSKLVIVGLKTVRCCRGTGHLVKRRERWDYLYFFR
nr:hypothetical protein CFP56_58741 [Quercus suber]